MLDSFVGWSPLPCMTCQLDCYSDLPQWSRISDMLGDRWGARNSSQSEWPIDCTTYPRLFKTLCLCLHTSKTQPCVVMALWGMSVFSIALSHASWLPIALSLYSALSNTFLHNEAFFSLGCPQHVFYVTLTTDTGNTCKIRARRSDIKCFKQSGSCGCTCGEYSPSMHTEDKRGGIYQKR